MSRATRLLFVVNQAEFFLSHRLPLAQAARDAGYSVHVAMPPAEAVTRMGDMSLTYHAVSFSRRGMHPFKEMGTMVHLFRLYRSLRPQIVHHVTIKPVIYGGIAARLARVPAVVSAITGLGHVFVAKGVRAAILRVLVRRAYKVALGHGNSKVIFQNPDDQAVLAQAKLVPVEAAVLIRGAGVAMSEFTPVPEPHGTPVVVFAARMLWSKGVGQFVEAAKRLQREGLSARFVLVGEPDPGNPLAVPVGQLEEWARSGAVEWWGHCDDMPGVFAQSHIVCLPTSYGEGVPKVLIEAAACARAIVATDIPGCREIVRDGENGFRVPVNGIDELVGAMRTLLQDPAMRRRMGRSGREIAESRFSLDRVIAETLRVYDSLLGDGTIGGAVCAPRRE